MWGTAAWAAVLDFADFLHLGVSGSTSDDFQKIKAIALDLNIKNIDKIRFNYNKTVDRQFFQDLTEQAQAGEHFISTTSFVQIG